MTEMGAETDRVKIFDTTLRDGEQSPGISLNAEEKLRIGHQLARLGVDVIEAGFPIASPGDFQAVQAIAREVEGPVIAGLARVYTADIDTAAQAIRDAELPRIHTFISTSDIHIEHQMRTTREDVKGQARAGVAHAKSYVDDVEFSPMDATRSDPEFTAEVLQIAIDEGATTINIPDTVGYTQPWEFKAFIEQLYDLVPALGKVTLSVHCHNDFGLAVANSFAGVLAGARQVEAAINGIGERAGNAALEEFVMLVQKRNDGFETGINTRLLGPTSRLVSRLTGYPVPYNKAVVGRNAFQHESGIHQAGVLNDSSTFEIMSKEEVGMDHTEGIVLGKSSGRKAVKHVLQKEGVFKSTYLEKTYTLAMLLADRLRGPISSEQIVEIQDEAERRQTSPYEFDDDYTIEAAGKEGSFSARVKVIVGGVEKPGAAQNDVFHSDVDGATSALFSALNNATDTNYKLENFKMASIGKGKETIAKATVELKVGSKTEVGHGIAFDTNKASAWAYLDAIRRAQEKEQLKSGD
jgi:2-isopropylmalate synthase